MFKLIFLFKCTKEKWFSFHFHNYIEKYFLKNMFKKFNIRRSWSVFQAEQQLRLNRWVENCEGSGLGRSDGVWPSVTPVQWSPQIMNSSEDISSYNGVWRNPVSHKAFLIIMIISFSLLKIRPFWLKIFYLDLATLNAE